jgi:leucine dehydrogenase
MGGIVMSVAVPSPDPKPAGRFQAGDPGDGRAIEALRAPSVGSVPFDHEELVVRTGPRGGRPVIVAVHSTVLGPAIGGLRLWSYPATIDAARDALRLAAGMTLKAAAAGLDFGGGKGVICLAPGDPPSPGQRRAMLLDFADLVESLDGRYITAEDVGTSPEDMVTISTRTSHVTGLPPDRGGSGDPSPFTAIGVVAAMRACTSQRLGSSELAGVRVAVIGLGHVGEHLARRLVEGGAHVLATDILPEKRATAERLGAEWVDPRNAMLTECDVLAPCALGGAIDAANVDSLRCAVVCGSANNQLADDALAERLAERAILYAPDYVVNAGGLMHVCTEVHGLGEDEVTELVRGIETTMDRVLAIAAERGTTPLRAAAELARGRLAAASDSRAQVGH